MFLASKWGKCLQLVDCLSFYGRPGYSTPLPDHSPGFWRGSEQLSWCRSPHRWFVQNFEFSPHKNPLQSTLELTPRCNFELLVRGGTLELQNVLYATHARFGAMFLVWFCAHGFVQKPGGGWCKTRALKPKRELALWWIFFIANFIAFPPISPIFVAELDGNGDRLQNQRV